MSTGPSTQDRRSARPASHGSPTALLGRVYKDGVAYDAESGQRLVDAPTLIEVERKVWLLEQQLEERTENYDELSDLEARARADWEEHRDRIILSIADSGERTSEDVRLARAKGAMSKTNIPGEDLYRVWLISKAALDSCGKNMTSLGNRSSVQQSLLKHLRLVAGFNE